MTDHRDGDVWDFWRKARQNPNAIGTYELPLYVDTPEVGFWRYFDKRADRWIPVAFFVSDDADEILCCHVAGHLIEPLKMGDTWHRCCRHPISYAQYQAAVGGDGFADEPPPVGHNLSTDLHEQLMLEVDAVVELANALLKKDMNQDSADQLAILTKRLSEIRKRADDEHAREKRPHLEAGRAVDDRWRPLRERVTDFVTLLKKHLQPWLESHADAAGRTGARVSLRRVFIGEIVNVDLFFQAVKDRPEVRDSLQRVANQLAKAHAETPGLAIREEARAI